MTGIFEATITALAGEIAGRFTQHRRILRLSLPAGVDLLAESLRGDEGIDEGFRFQVTALALDADIPLKTLLGQSVLLELETTAHAAPRAFHGHVTAAELLGANGGFARYSLTIEPWTAFLALGRDSRVFQDKTVLDILDAVFKAYDGKGRLAPSWRFDISDRSIYPQRSLTTQYQESDLAFAERLMSEEGLFYFFEHEAAPDSPSLGRHTLVIADHNGAFQPNAQADVRFTQPGAVMREDSLDRWRTEVRMQTNTVELASWDYRTRSMRAVASAGGDGNVLAIRDVPGVYAYTNRAHGERIADNQLEGLEARRKTFVGAGTVRTFVPGTTFTLHDHSLYDGGDEAGFIILRVSHLAHNNLNADTGNALERLLGASHVQQANDADLAKSLHATGRGPGERPVYRNRIDAIPASAPYRPSRTDGHGQLLHPRPVVRGQQTAIVVGPPGAVIHTDRDHRIKVQFHWQRGEASHSRLDHPAPDGHTGAPADDRSGTWVRVATPLAPVAGANWGSHALPRVGQEVLVDFLDGNIDRPVVIGTVYNGAGQTDAQHNQAAYGAGAATGNAPMWFPGESGAHAHAAVLSGIKSQALQASQSGTGAYSQLVFDDTPDEARVALQHHATAHKGTAELNLGHLRHQTDNQRLGPVGLGAELKTEHAAAVRAGSGMLLSTDRAGTAQPHLDSNPAAQQIEAAAQLQTDLASTAQKHNARLDKEPDPDKLPAIEAMRRSAEVVRTEDDGAVGYAEPHLQVSAPAGIAATTPASAVFSAGASTSLAAGQDLNFAAQGNLYHSVKAGISMFTYGKASNANKPNQETGIRLHAASGKVSSQSQSGATRLTADKLVTVASVGASVNVAAREHVLLTAQGAYLKLEGGNIQLHGPGKVEFKASMKELAGPESASPELPALPHPDRIDSDIELNFQYDDLDGIPNAPYIVTFADGTVRKGTLDDKGHAVLKNVPPGEYLVEFGEDPRDWAPPPEPEPDYKKPDVREQARLEIERARAAYLRAQRDSEQA
jgi:type VI secretion system VgrG family protein